MLQLRQPYVRPTGFLKETPQLPHVVASRANKGGHHEFTPKQIRVCNVFVKFHN